MPLPTTYEAQINNIVKFGSLVIENQN